MVNSSLAYEILLYINSFYFGLFATCELGTLILKSVLIGGKYDDIYHKRTRLGQDYGVLVALFIVEAARLFLGRKGSLSERDVPVMFSVLLTVPSIGGVVYLLKWQVVILRIEYIWCTLMLSLQMLEFMFASMFIVTMCRGPSYD
ncbi:transmembrane protein 80-like [Vanessa atalanta]|uniref:transmembrane protein 80-like n=1 Tax=Vanessa atalanta TaxID=42275 RepID=UPI000E778FE4|nr:transmembrane protein 80-like [Vanessa tameamea]XP_047539885.1 transmembrane protein 80-like [Vanessa atalanta]